MKKKSKQKKNQNFKIFAQRFDTEAACLDLLYEIKWKEGYTCRDCGCHEWVKGRTKYYRRCKSCHIDESVTSQTLFHKIKFPISKAFWIIYQLSTSKKGMSSMEIARQFGITQKTAWFFFRKVQEAIHNGDKSLKNIQEIAKEEIQPRDKRARERTIKRFIMHSPRPENGIDFHLKLKPHHERFIKNWMLGIHHRISESHMKRYVECYQFRYIHREHSSESVHLVLRMFVKHAHLPFKQCIAK